MTIKKAKDVRPFYGKCFLREGPHYARDCPKKGQKTVAATKWGRSDRKGPEESVSNGDLTVAKYLKVPRCLRDQKLDVCECGDP